MSEKKVTKGGRNVLYDVSIRGNELAAFKLRTGYEYANSWYRIHKFTWKGNGLRNGRRRWDRKARQSDVVDRNEALDFRVSLIAAI